MAISCTYLEPRQKFGTQRSTVRKKQPYNPITCEELINFRGCWYKRNNYNGRGDIAFPRHKG